MLQKLNMKQLELDGIETALTHQLSIDMSYREQDNKVKIGKARRECTMKYCGRFGFVSPSLVRLLYSISHAMSLEHLNKLVKEGLLSLVETHRVIDARVYVLTHTGAKYASELLHQHILFRSASNPLDLINQNTIMHDVILQYTYALGLKQSKNRVPEWRGVITEREFKRIYPASEIRSVDALVCETDGTLSALEMEHSFKNLTLRKNIILRYVKSLNENIYEKIFLISHSEKILHDAKRLNMMAVHSLRAAAGKSKDSLSDADAERVTKALVYRTKFCEALTNRFYR